MSEEKRPEEKRPNENVEWSFDFARLGESMKNLLNALAGEEDMQTSEFAVARGSATLARVNIDYSVGQGTLRALAAASPNLLEATIVHVGRITLSESGDTVKHVKLEQDMDVNKLSQITAPIRQGLRALANSGDLRWDVLLSPEVPLSLSIDGGVGPVTADLSGLQLTELSLDNGVGAMYVTLPAGETSYTTKLDGGVGETKITVPAGIAGKLMLDMGVGAIEVTLPRDLAVRLEAETGIGSISVPAHFEPVKDGFMGKRAWQTPGYELAASRYVIEYEGGVGALRIRVPETV